MPYKKEPETLCEKNGIFLKNLVLQFSIVVFSSDLRGGPSNDLDDMLYGLLDINGETD